MTNMEFTTVGNIDTFCLFYIQKNDESSGDSLVKAEQKQQQSPHGKKDFAAEHKHNEDGNTKSQRDAPSKRYADSSQGSWCIEFYKDDETVKGSHAIFKTQLFWKDVLSAV